MDDQQSTAPDVQDDSPQAKIQRAKKQADQWKAQYEEWAEEGSILYRFQRCTPHQLIEMFNDLVNEHGKKLTSARTTPLVCVRQCPKRN